MDHGRVERNGGGSISLDASAARKKGGAAMRVAYIGFLSGMMVWLVIRQWVKEQFEELFDGFHTLKGVDGAPFLPDERKTPRKEDT